MPLYNLLAEVLVLEAEIDDAQRKIDRVRTHLPKALRFVHTALDRRELNLDVQRIRVDAAKQYLEAMIEIESKSS